MHSVINWVTKYLFTKYVIRYLLNTVHAATDCIRYRIRVAYGKLKLATGNIFKKPKKREKRNIIKEYSFSCLSGHSANLDMLYHTNLLIC